MITVSTESLLYSIPLTTVYPNTADHSVTTWPPEDTFVTPSWLTIEYARQPSELSSQQLIRAPFQLLRHSLLWITHCGPDAWHNSVAVCSRRYAYQSLHHPQATDQHLGEWIRPSGEHFRSWHWPIPWARTEDTTLTSLGTGPCVYNMGLAKVTWRSQSHTAGSLTYPQTLHKSRTPGSPWTGSH